MKNGRRLILNIFYIFLGAVLFTLGFAEIIDEYWSGMGSALMVIGVIRTVQFYRLRKDPAYREKMEVEVTDERNRFIRNKAWAWAGYLFILVTAVSTVVLKVLGQDLLSTVAGLAVSFMMILYWICYLILRKKY